MFCCNVPNKKMYNTIHLSVVINHLEGLKCDAAGTPKSCVSPIERNLHCHK